MERSSQAKEAILLENQCTTPLVLPPHERDEHTGLEQFAGEHQTAMYSCWATKCYLQ